MTRLNVLIAAFVLFIVFVALTLFLGGTVTLTPWKVVIKTDGPSSHKKLAVDSVEQSLKQQATATGKNAQTINAADSVNLGVQGAASTGNKSSKKLDQESIAQGDGARAINAGGDVNVR